jgi:hypothetical protein
MAMNDEEELARLYIPLGHIKKIDLPLLSRDVLQHKGMIGTRFQKNCPFRF